MADISPTTAMKVKKVPTESPGHDSGRPNEAQRQPSAPSDPSAAHCRMVLVEEPNRHLNPTSHRSDDGGSSDPLGALRTCLVAPGRNPDQTKIEPYGWSSVGAE
uniref:Uncharacterized protein n=1 Tax=Moniliophthora roreri TaxID=221103 RepID=A0A0W0FBY2_MONRR